MRIDRRGDLRTIETSEDLSERKSSRHVYGRRSLMQCSHCGKCCEETEMELSSRDIKRLEGAGYRREEFTVTGKDGVTRLRNIGSWCYFYNYAEKRCRAYEARPMGCYLYPVVYSVDEGVVIDELCPMGETVSEHELRTKGRILIKLLKTMENERAEKVV